MKLNSIRQTAALGLCCVALASVPAAHAQDKMTAEVADRPPADPGSDHALLLQLWQSGEAERSELLCRRRRVDSRHEALQGPRRHQAGLQPCSRNASSWRSHCRRRGPCAWCDACGRCCAPARQNRFQRDDRQSTDHRPWRHGHFAGHFHRIPAGKGGRSDEDDDAGKRIRHLGQGEGPVALQDPSDRERQ